MRGEARSSKYLAALFSVKAKYAGLVIGATLISCLAVSVISYEIGKKGLIEASKLRLDAVALNQAKALLAHKQRIDQALAEIGENTAVGDMANAAATLLSADKQAIRRVYQDKSKSVEERAAYDGADQKLVYGIRYSGVHRVLASARKNTNVNDIYVIDQNGVIVYTVTKGDEFNTNINDPQNEPIRSFYDTVNSGADDQVHSSGFIEYKTEDGTVSAFVAKPLAVSVWGNIERRGVIMVRVSEDKLAGILAPEGLGDSVDVALLLASDGSLRAGSAGSGGVPPMLVEAAKDGKAGSDFAAAGDRRTFYSYIPMVVFGEKHLLVIGQDEGKILASARELALWAFLATSAVLVCMGAIGIFVSSRLTRPLVDLSEMMHRLNNGDRNIQIATLARRDEIGTMARALESFRLSALEKERMEERAKSLDEEIEQEREERDAEKARNALELEDAVSALAAGLRGLSQGKLDLRIDRPFVPSLDHLRADFNQSVGQLETTVRMIAGSVDTIRGGSSDLRAASENLSHRTERQAASLEEAAAALGEMTALVAESKQRCETAVTVAANSLSGAKASSLVVNEAITAMERIESSSSRIIQIIDVIEEIAFQTNLLALNAGVEAARAGDAGKGFAVVAQEVRELAQRSSAAARDISQLINTSTANVESGVALVLKTGEGLHRIEENIAAINGHITVIAAATQDQSSRLAEISSTVNALDQVTQQNATMVEETTAAAFALANEAEVLNGQVGHFSVAFGATGASNTGSRAA